MSIIVAVKKNKTLYRVLKNSDMLLPDGIGMVMAARILHRAEIERIPGSEFIFDICRLAQEEGRSIFVFGSQEKVNKKSVEIIKAKHPGLIIAGRENGYVSDAAAHQSRPNAPKVETGCRFSNGIGFF